MANSTRRQPADKPAKPEKPYRDFPLYPHATRRWAKRIRGKLHYFGSWADGWESALAEFDRVKADLYAGRTPPPKDGAGVLTVKDLLNRFLESKQLAVKAGRLAERTFRDYGYTAERILRVFGPHAVVANLGPADFSRLAAEMLKTMAPVSMGTEIMKTKAVFRFAFDPEHGAGLLEKPLRFGPDFRAPDKRVIQRQRAERGVKMFEQREIKALLCVAPSPFRAMILLGVNCGFGNSDCATLPFGAIDLEHGWHNHARPKTGVARRAKLWPETVEAIREAIATRHTPHDQAGAGLVFITQKGNPWVRLQEAKDKGDQKGAERPPAWVDAVSNLMRDTMKKAGIEGRGRNFYALRHTFETIGGASKDQVAVNHIMGHSDQTMAAVYRERIDDERLQAVADHVRGWLFPEAVREADPATAPAAGGQRLKVVG